MFVGKIAIELVARFRGFNFRIAAYAWNTVRRGGQNNQSEASKYFWITNAFTIKQCKPLQSTVDGWCSW